MILLTLGAGLVGSLLLVWSTISSERAVRDQAARMSQIVRALRDIDRAALNAETGQRGYFITLDRSYLGPYELGRDLYPRALGRLQALADGRTDAQQLALLAQIETHGNAKFAELEGNVELLERGEIREAQQRILSNDGRVAMERLRNALTELERLERTELEAALAKADAAESRVLPLLAVSMLLVMGALVLGFLQAVRAAHAEAEAAQAHDLAEARDRADLLARELNHRVKNLFAVVLAIVRMSGREAPEAKPVIESVAARIHALLEAHEATQGQDGGEGAADMRVLVDKVLAPYRSDDNPAEVDGPHVTLTARQATPVGLVLHELATNAVKYGAWAEASGHVHILWQLAGEGADRSLRLSWRESCRTARPTSDREGFGTLLMRSSARQLGGSVERRFVEDGLIVDIEVPYPV